MEYLRWILLGAGALFVLLVYFYSRRRQRSAGDEYINESADIEGFSAVDLDRLDEGVGEVRVIARGDDRRGEHGHEHHDSATQTATRTRPAASEREVRDMPEAVIITLFILAQGKDQPFQGDRVNSAARACGLVFGEMNIFHKLDVNDHPVYSLANMLEPGSFDPATLFELRTTGLVVFLQLDMVQEPRMALDDMLATAYRLSEFLGGQLCNHRRQPISQQDTDEYRSQAANFER